MRVVALVSGGKDSLYNMLQCIAAGHEVVAIANVENEIKGEADSYMYQTVGHELVSLLSGALGLPMFRQRTSGRAICRQKNYVPTPDDEVEDLLELLNNVKVAMHVEGVSVGAIASDYQRTRVENVCLRLDLKCFAYLWKRNEEELLQEMINVGLDAVVIKAASAGLNPHTHLGMHIRDLQPHLLQINKKFGVNICGEGGEYETFTLDCPLFHRSIVIENDEKVILSDNNVAPVGYLHVTKAVLETKDWGTNDPVQSFQNRLRLVQSVVKNPYHYVEDCVDEITERLFPQKPLKIKWEELPFPFETDEEDTVEPLILNEYWKYSSTLGGTSHHVKVTLPPETSSFVIDLPSCSLSYTSGWSCVGNVIGSNLTNALHFLKRSLEGMQYDLASVIFINIFVRDISDLNKMNRTYSQFVPELLPPARVCVETRLPPEISVIISAVAHKFVSKSQNAHNMSRKLEKDGVHVQSISNWAPASIGPYSQCKRVGGIFYVAGQIPLIPGTMEIINKPIVHQCKLTLRHILRILKSMDEALTYFSFFQAICYVTSKEIASDILALWFYLTQIDHTAVTTVVVSRLPRDVQLEWEVVACSYADPEAKELIEVVGDFNVYLKRCVYYKPFATSLTCKISFLTKMQQRGLKSITPAELNSVIKRCVDFMRTDLNNSSIPVCILKLFYLAVEPSIGVKLKEIMISLTPAKVIITPIPILGCEDNDTFVTITGICH